MKKEENVQIDANAFLVHSLKYSNVTVKDKRFA